MKENKFIIDECKNPKEFSIKHGQVPIKLSEDLDESIKYLLWYVPNISSEQASKNALLLNPEYDDYIFDEIRLKMDLGEEDVLISDEITEELADHFRDSVCTDEQKLVMTLSDNKETKTMALLRHIRNAIAHGNFNVIDDLVIGFDVKKSQDFVEYRGIFKINPSNLLKVLRKIDVELTSEAFIADAFKRSGYHVEPFEEKFQRSHRFDLFAKKKDKAYAIEILNLKNSDKLDEDFVRDLINTMANIESTAKPILIINSSYLTEASKEELLKRDIIILDIKNIKKMNQGRDMVSEIVRDQEVYKNL